MNSDRLVLLHPPFADPTQPYLSLPTLKGHLRQRGLDARVVDLNVEAVHYLASRPSLERLAARVGARFLELNHQSELSFEEQREYRGIVAARPAVEELLGAQPTPIEVLRDPELFYDAGAYSLARERLDSLFDVVSAASFPYRFGFNRADREVVPWSFDLLSDYAESDSSPLRDFYRSTFEEPEDWNELADGRVWIDGSALEFVGISIVFPSQIPEAIHLATYLRRIAPKAFVMFGGPAIHQAFQHMDPDRRRELLRFVDAIGVFEGEATLESLLPVLPRIREAGGDSERARILREIPNLAFFDRDDRRVHVGRRFSLDLRDVGIPDYSDLDLDRYLAPSRTLLYAPTRGCYWGQCSFCYYGLSETATAAYREIPAERAASNLSILSQRYGVKDFYLSCDVLAPRYALALGEALIQRGSPIRWHCDLKIEKYFTQERVEILHRSGLRAAAFGIESGSDRILRLMRKGSDRETMTTVNRRFSEAGIATQWMTFTDHPDESVDEALETVSWIEHESEWISLFLVGEFGLERGSHIAQDPSRYGVTEVYFAEGDDLRLYALFRQRGGPRSDDGRVKVDQAIARVARRFASRPYPWAGAISTHHSFLHFIRFGKNAFKTHFAGSRGGGTPERIPIDQVVSHIAGMRRKPRFSVEAIARAEAEFLAKFLPRALYTTLPARREPGQGAVAPLSLARFEEAAAEVPPLKPHDPRG